MSLVHKVADAPAGEPISFRLQKNAQHLLMRRTCGLSMVLLGLLAGLPELVSCEITHPTRHRVAAFNNVPLADVAAWAQYGRGPIIETASGVDRAQVGFGGSFVVDGNGVKARIISTAGGYALQTEVTIYLNENGPFELVSDDNCQITVSNVVAGGTYEFYAPEQPVLAQYAQNYYQYDRSLIPEGDADRRIATTGAAGLIIPNNPSIIERTVVEWRVDDTTTEQREYPLLELLNVQGQANPMFGLLSFHGTPAQRGMVPLLGSDADLLVIDTKMIASVQLYKALDEVVRYTLITVEDRNNV